MMMATGTPTGSIVMGVARDAGGKVLQAAAAHGAEASASISGFSADGVTMASTGAAPGSAGAGSSSTAQSAGGLSTKTLVIAGGVVGAGALVAVAAGGGGSTAPGGGTTSNTLTGHWVGSAANGGGLAAVLNFEGVTCNYAWDLTSDLVQTGTTFTGTGTSVARGINCNIPLPPGLDAIFNGQTGSGSLSGTASNGTLSFQAGTIPFTGTYTATQLNATGTLSLEGAQMTWTWRQTKQ
jgi:hypothetical protein